MRDIRTPKRPLAEINMVPYIDVMLVLLIIFMITAPLLTQGVKVDLPKLSAKTLPAKQQAPLVVTVDAKGNYYLNVVAHPKRAINIHTLQTQVAAHLKLAKASGQTATVYVKGDRHVSYEKVVQVMVLLQQVGADKLSLVTEST